MSIVEKLNQIDRSLINHPKFSLEFFPPKTQQGLENLYDRIERMNLLGPQFIDITWGAGGTTAELSLEMASTIQAQLGVDTCLHLTCTNMTIEKLDRTLELAKDAGIKNILALRGDPPKDVEYQPMTPGGSQLQYAIDLVKYIEAKHPGEFCVGVAAYPEGQPDSLEPNREIEFLKQKVDAGAQFIITQFFYNAPLFVSWYKKCRDAGITVPIIPGIMPIQNYQNFRRLTNLCKSSIGTQIIQDLNEIQYDDQKVKDYGVDLIVNIVREVAEQCPDIKLFHFFTLNLERSTKRILNKLGWSNDPIHQWNPLQTQLEAWDDFPNGRFGDSRSPAFGEIDGYGTNLKLTPFEAIQHWGYPVDTSDVTQLFVHFLQDKIPALPWTDRDDLRAESKLLINELIQLNTAGLWTISSQPSLNGVPSDHAELGWGPKGGFLYQKTFIEFFCPKRVIDNLETLLSKDNNALNLTYLCVDNAKNFKTNLTKSRNGIYDVNTVTWGVFPSREVIQPTQIDNQSFLTFSEEAFQLWKDWAQLYPPKSKTNQFLTSIQSDIWLVNIVANDYFENLDVLVKTLIECTH